MPGRIRDYALVIGHCWRCYECRENLLADPETAWRGYKLTMEQRTLALELVDEHFATVMTLAAATGLSVQELEEAIDHPHARLRHLGVRKGDYYQINR